MKCPHCNALCADHQTNCIECRWPLVIEYDEPSPRLPRRAASLFLALGLAISVAFVPPNFPSNPHGAINVDRMMVIFGVSIACSFAGYLAGITISRSRRAQIRALNARASRTPSN